MDKWIFGIKLKQIILVTLRYLFYFCYFTIDQSQIQNALFASLIDCKTDKYSRFGKLPITKKFARTIFIVLKDEYVSQEVRVPAE